MLNIENLKPHLCLWLTHPMLDKLGFCPKCLWFGLFFLVWTWKYMHIPYKSPLPPHVINGVRFRREFIIMTFFWPVTLHALMVWSLNLFERSFILLSAIWQFFLDQSVLVNTQARTSYYINGNLFWPKSDGRCEGIRDVYHYGNHLLLQASRNHSCVILIVIMILMTP